MAIQRALISVSDKTGIVEFARRLAAAKIELISTGGTARLLREAGIAVRDISEVTGSPEMLSGRVKTLHPKVHGGILFRRADAEHRREVEQHGIGAIDLVIVNLYPFEEVSRKSGLTADELIENIDIGGPSMVRSAAKNFADVTVVTDPEDYEGAATAIETHGGVPLETRLALARKAYAATSRYDGLIAMELERVAASGNALRLADRAALPQRLHIALSEKQTMRYGENPHQQAAFYVPAGAKPAGFAAAQQLQGKELSYNNLADLDSAWRLAQEFHEPAVAIIKHNNPCGVAERVSQVDAYRAALACDPQSAFGGVIALNRKVDAAAAEEIAKLFTECIVAPGFSAEALQMFGAKKNLRLLEMPPADAGARAGSMRDALELRRISGGVLVQTPDDKMIAASELKTVTSRAPSEAEVRDLLFAWKVCKHVKSNAIVFAKNAATIGIGAGQMSRVDSVKIAVSKAQSPLAGSAMASDAFFPFPDSVEAASAAGATSVIQPGGSVRDSEVIEAANRMALAMVFTGVRHFRH